MSCRRHRPCCACPTLPIVESEALVQRRLDALKNRIMTEWEYVGRSYELIVEPEIFWRLGGPREETEGRCTMSAFRTANPGSRPGRRTAATANEVDETSMGEAVERHLSLDAPFMQWVQDPDRVDTEASDTIEMREGLTDGLETIKLTGLVPQFTSNPASPRSPATPSSHSVRFSRACAIA